MVLKGVKPKVKEKRLKMFVYGEAGIGKTYAALQFPDAYIIDCEKGTEFYAKTIAKMNSVVLQTFNPDEIKTELHELLETNHKYKTLIIDPITQVYNATQEKWTRIFEKNTKGKGSDIQDFGMRYWGKVKGDFKAIQRLILALDMNVIVTAHQKDVYGSGFSKIGVTFDSMKNDDYFFDLVFRINKKGGKRVAITVKERAEVGEAKFPEEFEWSYGNFLKFYGKDIIEKEAQPLKMADTQTIGRVKNMVNMLKLDEGIVEKWFDKAQAGVWEEFTADKINKCEEYLEAKLELISDKKGKK